MTEPASAIYRVRIAHRRSRPQQHTLKYQAFYLFLDLDELPMLTKRLRLFSLNKFNATSLFFKDHGAQDDLSLRPWVEEQLCTAGIDVSNLKIRLLCLPRILGYAFNPISIFYCYSPHEELTAILYEVRNTFGERHTYLFKIEDPNAQSHRHECAKELYVSPFLEVTGDYKFRIKNPGEKVFLHIHQTNDEGPILDAWIRGHRESLTDLNLVKNCIRFPLLTIKVMAGIHWEAAKLWLKGVGLKKRPPPPAHAVTAIDSSTDQSTR